MSSEVVCPHLGINDLRAHFSTMGVDMKVVSSSCDAAAHIFPVVLKVHGKERDVTLRAPNPADPIDDRTALLHTWHKSGDSVLADRHIVEIKAEESPFAGDKAEEFIAGNGINILTGITDGDPERDPALAKQIHRAHDSRIVSLAAARVVRIRRSFDRQKEHEVAEPECVPAQLFIDQR